MILSISFGRVSLALKFFVSWERGGGRGAGGRINTMAASAPSLLYFNGHSQPIENNNVPCSHCTYDFL